MNNSSAESSNQIKKIKNIDIPSPNLLRNLAVSESGFVFNPSSGHSFSVNETGLTILQELQRGTSLDTVIQQLLSSYNVSRQQAERDIIEFVGLLRKQIEA